MCSDVYLEVDLVVQKQQINGIDREQQRIHLVEGTGTAFEDRTKRYVPTSVPFEIPDNLDHGEVLDLLQNPDVDLGIPTLFCGIHACDGLALQQNMETVHLNFKTLSIDESPSEYLGPLIQLHGDKGMDRICQASGRGLTDFSEDKFDRGEN